MPRVTQKADPASPAAAVSGSIPAAEPTPRGNRRRTKKKQSITQRVLAHQATVRQRGELNATNYQIGKPPDRDFGATGPVLPSGLPQRIVEPVEGPNAMKLADEIAFMNEEVLVVVHTTSDQNADPYPMVAVNGNKVIFERGQEKVVKRYIVERLARARINTVRQREYVDNEGNKAIANRIHGALAYPFAVLSDPNPRGPGWLKSILAQQ